jgi:hypothetical protein
MPRIGVPRHGPDWLAIQGTPEPYGTVRDGVDVLAVSGEAKGSYGGGMAQFDAGPIKVGERLNGDLVDVSMRSHPRTDVKYRRREKGGACRERRIANEATEGVRLPGLAGAQVEHPQQATVPFEADDEEEGSVVG